MASNIKFSCIIIGYNTKDSLLELLDSINSQNYTINDVEIIYIDDGSNDLSYDLFINYNLKYIKKADRFDSNRGRVAATQRGITLASGQWVLTIQSNITMNNNLFSEYTKIIKKIDSHAFMGCIKYESEDKIFMNYLNNKKRGINPYKDCSCIPYQFLLFGNSLIKKSIFEEITLNMNLKKYGGEELDFSFSLNKKYPKMIHLCKSAIVIRKNHPNYLNHCSRLYDFGEHNLQYLNNTLQKKVVGSALFLLKIPGLFYFFNIIVWLSTRWYNKINIKSINHIIIKIGLLSSILAGYHKTK